MINNNNFKLEKKYLINNNDINYKYNIEESYKNENKDLRENDYLIEDNSDNKEYSIYNDKINYKFTNNLDIYTLTKIKLISSFT